MGNSLFNKKSEHNWPSNGGPMVPCDLSKKSNIGIPVIFRKRSPFYQRNNLTEMRECVQKLGHRRYQRTVKRPRKRKTKPTKKRDLPSSQKAFTCSSCLIKIKKGCEKRGRKKATKSARKTVVFTAPENNVPVKPKKVHCPKNRRYLCRYCSVNCV